jgi:hypothetical protein
MRVLPLLQPRAVWINAACDLCDLFVVTMEHAEDGDRPTDDQRD